MTTIAYDGRYVAADGRMTRGNIICSAKVRKMHLVTTVLRGVEQEVLVFGAGSWNGIYAIIEWMKVNDVFDINPELPRPNFPGSDDDEGASRQDVSFITKDGQLWCLDGFSRPAPYDTPAADGSGFPFAQTAMVMGCNAVEAVREAIKLDTGSGGEITCFDVENWCWVEDVNSL